MPDLDQLKTLFYQRTAGSRKHFERASKLLPGGAARGEAFPLAFVNRVAPSPGLGAGLDLADDSGVKRMDRR